MRITKLIFALACVFAIAFVAAACGNDDDDAASSTTTPGSAAAESTDPGQTTEADESDDPASYDGEVVAMIVRAVGEDLETFTTTRDAYVADLEAQDGISTDREFEPFLSFLTFAEPEPPVYIGLTQGNSLEEFSTAADAVDPDLQAAYFPTFDIEAFSLLRPLDSDTAGLDQIAVEPGQVLEIAWRDLSTYGDFDQGTYETARDAYLAELATFDGWVAEYQWVSADGQDLAVGMTVYEDAEQFQAIATDADFNASDAYQNFIGNYPIAGGYASYSVKPDARPAESASQAEVDQTDDVAALVVRSVGNDLEAFTTTRDAYVADLEAQDGISTDREFEPFLSFLTFAEPEPPVYIGLTQGNSLEEFSTAADAVDPDLQAAYFPTFDIEVFDLLTPTESGTPVDISAIAVEPGQILEVAWRDLSTYGDFDQSTYETARDAYLAELATFDGWVAEYQWVSATGGSLVVGMTVYEDAEQFQAIATNADFNASDAYQNFIGNYPIAGGYASVSIK